MKQHHKSHQWQHLSHHSLTHSLVVTQWVTRMMMKVERRRSSITLQDFSLIVHLILRGASNSSDIRFGITNKI